MRVAGALALAVGLALALPEGEARANGRYPHATQVVFARDGAIALRATYGIVWLRGGTHVWSWVCEDAIGYGGVYDPPLAFAGNTLVVALEEGIARSDDGCRWSRAEGAARAIHAADATADAGRVLAVTAPSGEPPSTPAAVLESLDAGVTWRVVGALPAGLRAETIEVAPSQPGRVYVSGTGPSPGVGALARSDDGGATWRVFRVSLAGARAPYIGAVDPRRADTLYLRIDGESEDRLVVSHDGGATVRDAFVAKAKLLGLALSPDGERVAIGGPLDGIQVADTRDLTFRTTSTSGVTCLAWTRDGLFACGLEPAADFGLGVSSDEGVTFRPLYRARALTPLACSDESAVAQRCPLAWPPLRAVLVPDEVTVDSSPPPDVAPRSRATRAAALAVGALVALWVFFRLRARRRAARP